METDALKHSLTLTLPFPHDAAARIVHDVLRVDRQLRPRDVVVEYTVRGSDVFVAIRASTLKQLRLSVNAALENAALVTKTMDAFGSGSPAFAATRETGNAT